MNPQVHRLLPRGGTPPTVRHPLRVAQAPVQVLCPGHLAGVPALLWRCLDCGLNRRPGVKVISSLALRSALNEVLTRAQSQ